MERKKKVGHYILGPTIGEGKYSTFRQGTHTLSGEKVAVKIVHKKVLVQTEAARRNFRREAILLQKLSHPNVVSLYEALETSNSYYLVVELAGGGSLKQHVAGRKLLNEDEAQHYFRQMTSALRHLHTLNIVHRDLTLENFLMKKNMDLLLTGFGYGSVCEKGCSLDTQCRSTIYTAPEILYGRVYGPAVDIWSLGICLHMMLTGRFPFPSGSVQDVFKLHSTTLRGCRAPQHLSKACQDILSRLLEPTENKRISIFEIIRHKWVTETSSDLLMRPKSKCGKHLLDKDILSIMVKVLNFNEPDIISSFEDNKINSATATYKLLSKRNLPLDQFLEYLSEDTERECGQSIDESKVSNSVSIVSKTEDSKTLHEKSADTISKDKTLSSSLRTCVLCENERHVLPVCGLRILSVKDNHFEKGLFRDSARHKLPDILKHQHKRQQQKSQDRPHYAHKHLHGQCSVAYAWSTKVEANETKPRAQAAIWSISARYKVRTSSAIDMTPTVPPNTSHGLRNVQPQDAQEQNDICVRSEILHDLLLENSSYSTDRQTATVSKPESSARNVIDSSETVPSSRLLAIRTSSGRSMAILKKMAKRNKQGTSPMSSQMVPGCAATDAITRSASSPSPRRSPTSRSDASTASNDDRMLPVIKVTITSCRH